MPSENAVRAILSASLILCALLGCGGDSGGSPPSPRNQVPVANAGADQTASSGQLVSLVGSGTDSDGSISGFSWTQTQGPAVALSSAAAQSPSFTAPAVAAATVLRFSLVVRDNAGATSPADSVDITVQPASGPVTVSGRISFDFVPHNPTTHGLSYAGTSQRPARGVTVQAIRSSNSGVLATTVTDAGGNYSLSLPSNTQMFLRVRAEMLKAGTTPAWDFRVVDNTSGDALYTLNGSAFNSGAAGSIRDLNAASGFDVNGNVIGARAAAPFAILDSMFQAFNKVLSADPAAVFPPLLVGWSINNRAASGGDGTPSHPCAANGNLGTSFYTSGVTCILGAANSDADEYDDHVIIHEWGHYFEDNFSRSDSIGGPHGDGDLLDFRVAFGEGFGNAWSGIVTDNPVYRDASGSRQASGFAINVDNNNNVSPGWFSEGSVQSILYDLYDSSNDGADSVSLGVGPLLAVLRGPQRSGVPLTSIFSFISELKAANTGSASAISTLVNAQSINGSSINAYGTTETNNSGSADVLPVYTDISLNGPSRSLCSIRSFGESNKLSVSRFLKFTLTGTRTITFTATGGSDPDLYLHRAGPVGAGISGSVGTESFSQSLSAGDYVLEVHDFANADDDAGTGGRSCISISITG